MKKSFLLISTLFLTLLGLAFNMDAVSANPVGTAVDVTITSTFDEFNTDVQNVASSVAYGSKVAFDTLLEPDDASYSFVFWSVNGTVQSDLPKNFQFTVTNNLDLVGVFKPVGKFAVAFMDANGQLIDVKYVTSGGDAVAPDTTNYTKPGLEYDSQKWSVGYTNVTQDIVTVLQYVPAGTPATYTLSVENGSDVTVSGTGTYDLNTIVTVEAVADDSNTYFQYWRIGNRIVSYSRTYSFTMLENVTVTAVYGGVAGTDAPVITVSGGLSLRGGYTSYLGQYYLPSGNTFVEYGLIEHATLTSFTLDDDNVTQYAGTKINGTTKEFLISLDSTGLGNIRAYMVYKDSEEALHTVYSIVETAELFISEYGEGSGYYNKWVEIYNPTGSAVDLSGYTLKLYSNGATTPTTSYTLPSVSLASHDCYVVYYSASADSAIVNYGDSVNAVVNFSGDDAFGLYKGSTLIDLIGVIGTDPGTAWVESGISTLDHTLIRKLYVTSPNANWNPGEWIQYNQDYFDNVGIVGFPTPESVTISGATSVYETLTITLSAVVNPHGTSQAVTWSSSAPATASVDANTGVVTGVAAGTVTIYATATQDGTTVGSYEITVNTPVYYTVSFEENGGSLVDNQSIIDGQKATEPTNPTRDSYTFGGWYTDDTTFVNAYDFNSSVTADITIYAKWISSGSGTYATDLFISEYIEGSGTIRAIEIYNGTGSTIDLSSYRLVNYYNGNVTVTALYMLTLSGSLAHGQVAVVYYSTGATAALISAANSASLTISTTSSTLNFNGDDAISLEKNVSGTWTKIDVIGQIGLDPGSAWTVGTVSTANMTLVRKSSIIAGDNNPADAFDPSAEWTAYPQDTTTYLGSHTADVTP